MTCGWEGLHGRPWVGRTQMAMARQEDSSVMLSRSEASHCPARQTLRFARGDTVRHLRLMPIAGPL